MLKPTRTILALAAGSLVLGLVGAGAAVADDDPVLDTPGQESVVDDEDGTDGRDEADDQDEADGYPEHKHSVGVVVSRGPLTLRAKPSTRAYKVGKVYPHHKIAIECKKHGERVDGNSLWYLLKNKRDDDRAGMDRRYQWVSARYVKNLTEVKYCR
ncbi:SH3 domain-containing protein [Streptomyces sp. NPDC054956]